MDQWNASIEADTACLELEGHIRTNRVCDRGTPPKRDGPRSDRAGRASDALSDNSEGMNQKTPLPKR